MLNCLNSEEGKTMEPIVHKAKVIEIRLNDEVFLAFDMPREPRKAKMSFPFARANDPKFRHLLGKTVEITIKEAKP